MVLDKEIVGKRLRRQREHMALTREEFAEQIEISPQFLAEIENGTKGMSAETLYKICEKANLSADYLLLGRQSANGIEAPAVEMLCKIPPRYTQAIEDVIRAFTAAIAIAASKDEE